MKRCRRRVGGCVKDRALVSKPEDYDGDAAAVELSVWGIHIATHLLRESRCLHQYCSRRSSEAPPLQSLDSKPLPKVNRWLQRTIADKTSIAENTIDGNADTTPFWVMSIHEEERMAKKRVVVRGGGENLYYVSDSGGVFYVKKASTWGSGTDLGKTRSLEDALAIIKSHSGRDIEKIE